MIFFRTADDYVHHIGKARATDAPLPEFVVDLGRDDQLPRIGVKKAFDDSLDVAVGDDVAVADKHGKAPFQWCWSCR